MVTEICYALDDDAHHHLCRPGDSSTLCDLPVNRRETFDWAAGCGPRLHAECMAIDWERQAAALRTEGNTYM